MTERKKARAVGFNHVALEVGDIDEALKFYGNFIDFELRGKSDSMAFIDLGDQFLALQKGRRQPKDDVDTSVSWYRTKRRFEARWKSTVSRSCQVASSISMIPGAIESKSSATPIFNSRRLRMCFAVWVLVIYRNPTWC